MSNIQHVAVVSTAATFFTIPKLLDFSGQFSKLPFLFVIRARGPGDNVPGKAPQSKQFFVSNMPHHGKVNFGRDAKWSVLRPTVCESLRVSKADK